MILSHRGVAAGAPSAHAFIRLFYPLKLTGGHCFDIQHSPVASPTRQPLHGGTV